MTRKQSRDPKTKMATHQHVGSSMTVFPKDRCPIVGRSAVLSWGANSYGQLANRKNDDVGSPSEINIPLTPRLITGGGGHTLMISDTGSLFSCGWNIKGQLGLTDVPLDNVSQPHLVDFFSNTRPHSVAGGWDHSVLCTENGDVFTWGSNAFGQLGCPSCKEWTNMPVKVQLCDKIVAVAAGLRHSLVLTESGKLFAWGSGKKGQLGVLQDGRPPPVLCKPHEVRLPDDATPVRTIACGAYHSAACTESGAVYVWGNNKHGQMALPPAQQISAFLPHQVAPLTGGVVSIASGWTHLLALIDSGEVVTWGRNDFGQLGRTSSSTGTGTGISDPYPARVPGLSHVIHIACGSEHNLALTADGRVFSWGWNEHGICGTGGDLNVAAPHQVAALAPWRSDVIGCGNGHSFAFGRPR